MTEKRVRKLYSFTEIILNHEVKDPILLIVNQSRPVSSKKLNLNINGTPLSHGSSLIFLFLSYNLC
jgi:hypothetical protein